MYIKFWEILSKNLKNHRQQTVRLHYIDWHRFTTYRGEGRALAELGPESDFHLVAVASFLVEAPTWGEGRHVQVEGHSAVRVRRVLHPVKTHLIWGNKRVPSQRG